MHNDAALRFSKRPAEQHSNGRSRVFNILLKVKLWNGDAERADIQEESKKDIGLRNDTLISLEPVTVWLQFR
jgi:hypothetical protein